MSARSISLVVGVIFLACAACLEFVADQKPRAPAVLIISNCGDLKPGSRRIGDYRFQFDVPADFITQGEGSSDVPMGLQHGYDPRPKNSASVLAISWYWHRLNFGGVPEVPALTYSGYVEKRKIFDNKGNTIGEDSWGYWEGERWRRVHLIGSIAASYGSRNKSELAGHGSVHEKDAVLFDEVISSACSLSSTL